MSEYCVRGVESLADVRQLVRLYNRVWPQSFGIVDLLAADGECWLVVDTHQAVLGYCFAETDARRGYSELQDIGVDSESRGRGLGRMLLEAVQRRHPRIKLIADATKPALLRFYESAGFRLESTIENYYSIGRDGARMSWSRAQA